LTALSMNQSNPGGEENACAAFFFISAREPNCRSLELI
jgi:hypothetical protein